MKIQGVLKNIKQLDKKVLTIVKNGLKWSFILCLIASLLLVTYTKIGEPNTYYIGITLFKSSLYYMVGCIVFGWCFNGIK